MLFHADDFLPTVPLDMQLGCIGCPVVSYFLVRDRKDNLRWRS